MITTLIITFCLRAEPSACRHERIIGIGSPTACLIGAMPEAASMCPAGFYIATLSCKGERA